MTNCTLSMSNISNKESIHNCIVLRNLGVSITLFWTSLYKYDSVSLASYIQNKAGKDLMMGHFPVCVDKIEIRDKLCLLKF